MSGVKRSGSVRRNRTYEREAAKFNGWVPCFCCGKHVHKREATLEHILPRALGGLNNRENLAISHPKCNSRRGHSASEKAAPVTPAKPRTYGPVVT